MKKIILFATGGTIASSDAGHGLQPTVNVDQLLEYIPDIRELCQLEGIALMQIDSTNMNPKRMGIIAKAIEEHYKDADGFVVAHGTDTMAYSAAALSIMLKNLGKPVVLTGSQLPIEAPGTDGKKNLSDAIRFACEGVPGVYLVFDGAVIDGMHAIKMKTRSMDAFSSVNAPEVAHIAEGRIVYNTAWKDGICGKDAAHMYADTTMCQDVIVLKLFPGMSEKIFDFVRENYRGVIIESFGIGGVPGEQPDLVTKVQELAEARLAVVITTQCLYEGVDLSVYKVGQKLQDRNVIMGGTMTTEALTMKLMWALAHFESMEELRGFMENKRENSKK